MQHRAREQAACLIKQAVELDAHSRQRDRLDGTACVNGFGVGAIWSEAPGRECALVGMDAPDLQVATKLILLQLLLHVVLTRGGRPDLDDEGYRVVIDLEGAGTLAQPAHHRHRDDADVGYVEAPGRYTQP